MQIDLGHAGGAEADVPFVRNLCWLNKTEFCYTWDSVADVRISLDAGDEAGTECYTVTWTPVHCHVELKVETACVLHITAHYCTVFLTHLCHQMTILEPRTSDI